MSDDLSDLYQEVILDHSRNPRNYGINDNYSRTARGNNPLCGDRVSIFLNIKDGNITDVSFDARGCAISLASASMMTEMIKGKTTDEARSLCSRFHSVITDEKGMSFSADMEELSALSGVRNFPTRIKCATLAWYAMTAALDGDNDEVKTE